MLDSLKDSLLASLGLVAMAQEKLEACLKELIERGEMTKEQADKLLASFVAKGEKEGHELSEKLSGELNRWIGKTPVVSRREFQKLEARVRTLEMKLGSEAPAEVEPLGDR